MDNEDEYLTADVNKEASDEDGVRRDEETSLLVETVEEIKQWMRQMEQEETKMREEIVRVSQNNWSLAEQLQKAESQRTEDKLGVIDFETRLLMLEDKVESLQVDFSRLPTRLLEGWMEMSIEAIRRDLTGVCN